MKKILIINGCEALWFLYKKELIWSDRIVTTITCKNKYLQVLNSEKPDLIIMDNMIPAEKQKFMLKKIRKNNKELPIILHSFVSGKTAEIKDMFLTKSYTLNELKHKANILLETRATPQESIRNHTISACAC